MKYSTQIKKRKQGKVVRKNPVPLILPAIPAIAEGAAALWAATVSAAPYIVAAFTTGATVGLIERKLNADRTSVDKISTTIPKTITLPEPLDWFAQPKSHVKPKTQTLPKTTSPIPPLPMPPQKPDMDWLKKFIEWFQNSVELNPLKTIQTTFQFIKNAPRQILDFVLRNAEKLDAWEKANPWKKRAFIFVWIVYVSPQIDKLVDYLKGNTEPFYKDTTFENLSKTLDRTIDAYPFLKNVNLVEGADQLLLSVRPNLQDTYPNLLNRTIYSYQIRNIQELQACAETCMINIKKYHKDVIGEHNTIFIPREIYQTYFDQLQFIPADPFSFKILQGLGSNCTIPKMYSAQNRLAPKEYLEQKESNWTSMLYALGCSQSYVTEQMRKKIFTPHIRYLLSLAASVTVSKARKYWANRYDAACVTPSVSGLTTAKNVYNNLPNIFDISDRIVPYVEENWTWANFSMLEGFVPKGPGQNFLTKALKPAFYYDVLQYIQNRRMTKTVQNLQATEMGRNKLQNVEMLYTQTILPIKKDISPLECQRIATNLIWVLMNDSRKLKNTPINQPYFLKTYKSSHTKNNANVPTIGQSFSSNPEALLQLAIENYLFDALGFNTSTEGSISGTVMYGYFRFSLSLLQLTSSFEQGLSNEAFIDGLKSLFGYLKDVSAGAVTKIIEDYAIVYVSQLLENRATILKSETMVVAFMWIIDLILPDFVRKYFVDWIYFNKDQNQVLENFYMDLVDVFVDHAPFSNDEVSNAKGIIYDRVLIPNLDSVIEIDTLQFYDKISQSDSARMLSGVIFFENEKV